MSPGRPARIAAEHVHRIVGPLRHLLDRDIRPDQVGEGLHGQFLPALLLLDGRSEPGQVPAVLRLTTSGGLGVSDREQPFACDDELEQMDPVVIVADHHPEVGVEARGGVAVEEYQPQHADRGPVRQLDRPLVADAVGPIGSILGDLHEREEHQDLGGIFGGWNPGVTGESLIWGRPCESASSRCTARPSKALAKSGWPLRLRTCARSDGSRGRTTTHRGSCSPPAGHPRASTARTGPCRRPRWGPAAAIELDQGGILDRLDHDLAGGRQRLRRRKAAPRRPRLEPAG